MNEHAGIWPIHEAGIGTGHRVDRVVVVVVVVVVAVTVVVVAAVTVVVVVVVVVIVVVVVVVVVVVDEAVTRPMMSAVRRGDRGGRLRTVDRLGSWIG